MVWRALAIAAAAMLLSGCNLVMSEKPLFFKADTKDTPVFKPGLWAADDPDCSYDIAKPKEEWPECAGGNVVPEGQGMFVEKDGAEILIAAGDPMVIQVRPPLKPDGKAIFFYGAVIPVARDEQGRVIRVEAWPVECGPPPPKPADGATSKPEDFVTKTPLPGLKIKEGNCLATDQKVVRKAAAASRAWQEDHKQSRWVREARAGEK